MEVAFLTCYHGKGVIWESLSGRPMTGRERRWWFHRLAAQKAEEAEQQEEIRKQFRRK